MSIRNLNNLNMQSKSPHSARGEFSSAFHNMSRWQKRAISATVAGTLAVGAFAMSHGDEQEVPVPKSAAEACDDAGIILRDNYDQGRGIVVTEPQRKKKKYFKGFDTEIVKESLAAADSRVVLAETALRLVERGETVGDDKEIKKYNDDEIACLNNGLIKDSVASIDMKVHIPVQRYPDAKGVGVEVVRKGDTYTKIAKRAGGADVSIDDVIINTSIPATALLPGDILTVKKNAQTQSVEIDTSGGELQSFIYKYQSYADNTEEKWGVPSSLVLAMSAVETGYGSSELAQQAYNFHGLKSNEQWNGSIYEKVSPEVVNGERISVKSDFKKFDSAKEGFNGFGEHLKMRKIGSDYAYEDAFTTDDPYEFLEKLFDDKGYKYATDPDYVKKVTSMLDRIKELNAADASDVAMSQQNSSEGRPDDAGNGTAGNVLRNGSMPAWSGLSPFQRKHIVGGEAGYGRVVEQIEAMHVSVAEYESFVSRIRQYGPNEFMHQPYFRQDTYEKLFPSDVRYEEASPRFVLHYTGWPSSAWGHDGDKYLSSAFNAGHGAANAYLERDGKTLWVYTAPDRTATHARRAYNVQARGVETPALVQSDITTEQYEGMVYAAAYFYIDDRKRIGEKLHVVSEDEMKYYLIGHGEITELKGIGDHTDFLLPIADALAPHLANVINEIAQH